MRDMRSLALENTTPERFIRFMEVEFRPSTDKVVIRRQRISHLTLDDDIELQPVPRSYSRSSFDSQVTLVETAKPKKKKRVKKGQI